MYRINMHIDLHIDFISFFGHQYEHIEKYRYILSAILSWGENNPQYGGKSTVGPSYPKDVRIVAAVRVAECRQSCKRGG